MCSLSWHVFSTSTRVISLFLLSLTNMWSIFMFPNSGFYSTYVSVTFSKTSVPGMLLIISLLLNPNLLFIIRYKHLYLMTSSTDLQAFTYWNTYHSTLGCFPGPVSAQIHFSLSLSPALHHRVGGTLHVELLGFMSAISSWVCPMGGASGRLESGGWEKLITQGPSLSLVVPPLPGRSIKVPLLSGDYRPWSDNVTSLLGLLNRQSWRGFLMVLSSRVPLL